MNIGIMGTGMVARAHAERLIETGHKVILGTRDPVQTLTRTEADFMGNPPFAVWQKLNPQARLGSFDKAASFGELLINATLGSGSLNALQLAGPENLAGKILVDVSNPLDFSGGSQPILFVSNTDSLGEQIQRFFPQAHVVKTLNTATAPIQVNPGLLADGDHHAFLCGNDVDAKFDVQRFLTDNYGWQHIADLGDISSARALEMMIPMWVRLFGAIGSPLFNFKVVGLKR
jgi:predicted dinucleotide-binding enzyme